MQWRRRGVGASSPPWRRCAQRARHNPANVRGARAPRRVPPHSPLLLPPHLPSRSRARCAVDCTARPRSSGTRRRRPSGDAHRRRSLLLLALLALLLRGRGDRGGHGWLVLPGRVEPVPVADSRERLGVPPNTENGRDDDVMGSGGTEACHGERSARVSRSVRVTVPSAADGGRARRWRQSRSVRDVGRVLLVLIVVTLELVHLALHNSTHNDTNMTTHDNTWDNTKRFIRVITASPPVC